MTTDSDTKNFGEIVTRNESPITLHCAIVTRRADDFAMLGTLFQDPAKGIAIAGNILVGIGEGPSAKALFTFAAS